MTFKNQNTHMEKKKAIVPFNLKSDGDTRNATGRFEGYGSVFGNIDFGGDVVQRGAFTKSLDAWRSKNELPQMLGFHNSSNVIGDWLEMSEDENGLRVKGELWVNGDKRIEDSVRAHNILRGTGPKGLSIGYIVKDYERQENYDGGVVTLLKEVELFEVSVVGFAMNPKASVTSVKSMTDDEGKILHKRDVEKVLRDAGLSKRQAKAFIAGGYEAIVGDDESGVEAKNRDDSLDLSGVTASLNKLLHLRGLS